MNVPQALRTLHLPAPEDSAHHREGVLSAKGKPFTREKNRSASSKRKKQEGQEIHKGIRTKVAWRTEKQSSPENTRWRVVPSRLIHFEGKLAESPGPTSQ